MSLTEKYVYSYTMYSPSCFVGFNFQFASPDRKIIELYDDLMSQVNNLPASKGNCRSP